MDSSILNGGLVGTVAGMWLMVMMGLEPIHIATGITVGAFTILAVAAVA